MAAYVLMILPQMRGKSLLWLRMSPGIACRGWYVRLYISCAGEPVNPEVAVRVGLSRPPV